MLTLSIPSIIYIGVRFYPNTRMMQAKVMNIHVGGLIGIGTRCTSSNCIIYGQRMLIKPNNTPCSSKYIQWETLLPLRGKNSVSLVDPFAFDVLNSANRVRQRVHHSNWVLPMEACIIFGITPSTLDQSISSSRSHN